MSKSERFKVRVWGEYACFTRPEFGAERVSYEVMTPSAARGILEAVLWKPAILWHVEKIHVLAPIRWGSVKRNEVGSIAGLRGNHHAYYVETDRQQRNTLLLRDVDYIIEAHFQITKRAGESDNIEKFTAILERRLKRGQCFHRPYLGCREFAANVAPAPESWQTPSELGGTRELGWILRDLDFTTTPPQPVFFEASLRDGSLEVPPLPEVMSC